MIGQELIKAKQRDMLIKTYSTRVWYAIGTIVLIRTENQQHHSNVL